MITAPSTPEADSAPRVTTTAAMKESDATVDDTYEEAWLCLDPNDLKILIPILTKSIESLPEDDQVVVCQVIGCMSLALARSEKQALRDGIVSGDPSAVMRAMKGVPRRESLRNRKRRPPAKDAP